MIDVAKQKGVQISLIEFKKEAHNWLLALGYLLTNGILWVLWWVLTIIVDCKPRVVLWYRIDRMIIYV